jgi:hypothetical protein
VAESNIAFPPAPEYVQAPAALTGPLGTIRGTGNVILLSIVTLGIYQLVWFYKVHAEMKRHSGEGLGGGIALLIALVVSPVLGFLTASEVGTLYQRAGRAAPVSGITGLWYFPGSFIIVGPFIWLFKVNGALNDYWRSLGAV